MERPASFVALLAELPVAERVRDDLWCRLAQPARHYHGVAHVALLWERHCRHGAGLAFTQPPWHRLIACAIAFHDAVLDTTRRDNEDRSAALWRASGADLDEACLAWVEGTILATSDHLGAVAENGMTPAAWAARLWVLDLDLTPIGEVMDEFAENTARLRRENAHLRDAEWESFRLSFLRRLAQAPAVYRSPALADVYAAHARANLSREIAG